MEQSHTIVMHADMIGICRMYNIGIDFGGLAKDKTFIYSPVLYYYLDNRPLWLWRRFKRNGYKL
jgi:hypothetical protein